MARDTESCSAQTTLLPGSFGRQRLPGTFYMLHYYLIDHEIDLSAFDVRYRNDETRARVSILGKDLFPKMVKKGREFL